MKYIGFKHQRENKQKAIIDIIMFKGQKENLQITDKDTLFPWA
jgi:hypothetical protein